MQQVNIKMKKGRSHGHFHGKQILYKIRKLILFYKKSVYDNKMHVNFFAVNF